MTKLILYGSWKERDINLEIVWDRDTAPPVDDDDFFRAVRDLAPKLQPRLQDKYRNGD